MLNVILNIIGITLVLYSVFVIKRDISMKKEDTNKKDLHLYKDEVVEDFSLLMDSKIKTSSIEDEKIDNEVKIKTFNKKSIAIIQDQGINSQDDGISPLHKKIMELEDIGLSNEEIAKKMGRGVREIDIVLKIYKKEL